MDKRKFLIAGVSIIHLHFLFVLVWLYSQLSLQPLDNIEYAVQNSWILLTVSFGYLLWKRFERTETTKWALVLCPILPVVFLLMTMPVIFWYFTKVESSSLTEPLAEAIAVCVQNPSKIQTVCPNGIGTIGLKVEYLLVQSPAYYLIYTGFYALLFLGRLDPRQPSNNKVSQFLCRLLLANRKANTNVKARFPKTKLS